MNNTVYYNLALLILSRAFTGGYLEIVTRYLKGGSNDGWERSNRNIFAMAVEIPFTDPCATIDVIDAGVYFHSTSSGFE